MTTFFRHYKNRYYQIVGEALDTRDDTLVIVYRTLYPSEYSLFTRPKEEFFGSVRCPDGSECLRFTLYPALRIFCVRSPSSPGPMSQ